MKVKIGFIICVVVLVTLVSTGVRFAGDTKDEHGTLKDIKGVLVSVNLKPEIKKTRLTKQQMTTDVELKLKSAGLKVLTEEELLKEKGGPRLYVNAHIRKNKKYKIYNYHISVSLNQEAILVRTNKKALCITWSTGAAGTTASLNVIRKKIKDGVDDFINAYLSVNPKK